MFPCHHIQFPSVSFIIATILMNTSLTGLLQDKIESIVQIKKSASHLPIFRKCLHSFFCPVNLFLTTLSLGINGCYRPLLHHPPNI